MHARGNTSLWMRLISEFLMNANCKAYLLWWVFIFHLLRFENLRGVLTLVSDPITLSTYNSTQCRSNPNLSSPKMLGTPHCDFQTNISTLWHVPWPDRFLHTTNVLICFLISQFWVPLADTLSQHKCWSVKNFKTFKSSFIDNKQDINIWNTFKN